MGTRWEPLVGMILQAELAADELADVLSALEGGREVGARFCERLLLRLAEIDRLAKETLAKWTESW